MRSFIILSLPFQLLAWTPLEYQDLIDSIECEQVTFETAFDTNVHVEAEISYPRLPGRDRFIQHVNQALKKDAHFRFDQYVQEMRLPLEDVWEDDDLNPEFQYSLYPIYCTSNLISTCGYEYRYRHLPHGSWRPIGRTFWQRDNSVLELTLDDLFLSKSGYQQFLTQYCEDYFRAHKYGYYAYEDPEWPKLEFSDLNTFVLLKKGLLIIFRMYCVDGLNDGPNTFLIPYPILKPFANPDGPIPGLLISDDH